MAIYLAPEQTQALGKAVQRGALRRIAHRVYTDDFDTPAERIVERHLLAILATLYPDWYLSHTTAATLRAHRGVAFISGRSTSRHATGLPGVTIRRVAPMPFPDLVTIPLDDEVRQSLRGEARRPEVRLSSPLQVVFELLRRRAGQPERTLPDEQVRAMIEALSATDLARAEAFAGRNGLKHELRRFERLRESLDRARTVELPRSEGLDVYFYHYRVGRLEALSHGEHRFTYDPGWPIPLSHLPRVPGRPAFEGRELPPFFDNCCRRDGRSLA